MSDEEAKGFLGTDDVTTSLLQEYSIAENPDMDGSLVQLGERENLRDAFSRYAKVIFHDIADSYPTDADVQCFFSLTLDMKHKEGDFVGLFRLGWRSPSDMLTSQLVPKPTSGDQRDFQVQFRASDLPKEEGEIYQLCYISQNEVWGASVPFEFRRATAEELLVVDSGDIVIVRSQSAVVEDLKSQLASLRKDLIAAEASNVEVGKKLTELLEENKVLKDRLKDLEKVEQVLDRLRADNQALADARNASEEAVRNANLHIASLNCVVSALHKDMEILQTQVNNQAEENAKYQDMVQNATSQRGCTQDLVDALREGKELAVREMRTALTENEKMQQDLAKAVEEKNNLNEKFNELSEKYNSAVQNQETNSASLEKRTEDLLVQLTQLTSDSHKRVSYAMAEAELLRKQVNSLEMELKQKEDHLLALNAQDGASYIMLPDDSPLIPENSSLISEDYMSLQTATQPKPEEAASSEIEVLEKRLADVKIRTEEVGREIQVLQADMDVLQQTEESLVQSHTRLKNRMRCLQCIISDAEGCGNTLEASLHQRELGICEGKLQERNICLESARQRRDELEKQLKELQEENLVLELQESETAKALVLIKNAEAVRNEAKGQEVNTDEASTSTCQPEASQNCQMEANVADLKEKLHDAAETYKLLYHLKLKAEKQLTRLQERE